MNKREICKHEIFKVGDLQKVIETLKTQMTSKTCVLLNGDLAAGKTTLVQLFCETYFLKNVSSPTFSLHQVYKNSHVKVDHFDLYRLNSPDDVETAGLWDVLSASQGLVFIEWPSRLSLLDIPLSWKLLEVHVEVLSEQKRIATVSCYN